MSEDRLSAREFLYESNVIGNAPLHRKITNPHAHPVAFGFPRLSSWYVWTNCCTACDVWDMRGHVLSRIHKEVRNSRRRLMTLSTRVNSVGVWLSSSQHEICIVEWSVTSTSISGQPKLAAGAQGWSACTTGGAISHLSFEVFTNVFADLFK